MPIYFYLFLIISNMTTSGPSQTKQTPDKKYSWSEDLSEFIASMDYYSPTIPESVVRYYLQKGGMNVIDERVVKLVAIAADKYLAG